MRWSRVVLRNLRRRPGRTAVSIASVAIGVTVFLSVSIGTRSLTAAFDSAGDQSLLRRTVALSPTGVFDGVAPSSAVEPIRHLPDVSFAEGTYDTRATIELGTKTEPSGLVVPDWAVAVAFTASKAMPPVTGRAPAPGKAEIVIGVEVGREIPVKVTDTVQVRTPEGGVHNARVTGVIASDDNQSRFAMTSPETMQAWTGSGDVVNNVIVGLAEGVDRDAWLVEHRAKLGPFQEATDIFSSDALKFFRTFDNSLAPLAASSLFVAGYLIFLTMGRAVQDRSTTIATLRALGTSRSQIVTLILGETAAVGVVGTAIGFAFGSVLGRAVTSMLRTIFNVHITGTGSTPSIPVSVIVVTLVLGLVTPVLAAVLPALLAARLDPAAHLRGEIPSQGPLSKARLLGGALAFAIGTSLTTTTSGPAQALAGLIALAGAALALPAASRPIGGAIAHVCARLRPGPGELAAQEMAGRPGRSAQTTALVAMTLMITFIVATLNASQRPEFIKLIDNYYGATADVYGGNGRGVTAAEYAALAADPAVAALSPGAHGTVTMLDPHGRSEPLAVIDPDTYFAVAGIPWASGTNIAAAVAGLRHGDVLLPTAIADRVGANVGDNVTLQTQHGPASFRVAGLFYGLGWGETVAVTVSTKVATEAFGLSGTPVVHVDLKPGVEPSAWGAAKTELFIDPTSRARATSLQFFDGVTNLALVLLVITVLVGVLGLANTLAMDLLDRQREIGVLRALGIHRREVRSMVLAQALILTIVAGALAVILGTVLGAAFVAGANHAANAIPMAFRFPGGAVPLILGASALIGAVAALTPARIASRMEPAEAIRLPVET